MQILEFIFSSFWVFFGVMVLIGMTFNGIAEVVQAWRRKP